MRSLACQQHKPKKILLRLLEPTFVQRFRLVISVGRIYNENVMHAKGEEHLNANIAQKTFRAISGPSMNCVFISIIIVK